MAQFNVYGIDTLLQRLDKLANTEEIIPRMLDAGMKVLDPQVVAEAEKHKVTGDMAASVKPTGINHDSGGYYVCTRPTGKDRNGIRNMEKMAWLEFGVKGRAATPVITAAVLKAEMGTLRAMRECFENEVAKI